MNDQFLYPLCEGTNCPRKADCWHFKRDINKMKEQHFGPLPLKEDGSCGSFKQKPVDDLTDKIKTILDSE